MALTEQVSDLFMYMTEEIDIGGTAWQSLVFHQEVVEPGLQLITLSHHSQLEREKVT